jgi:hypothetical protein
MLRLNHSLEPAMFPNLGVRSTMMNLLCEDAFP